MTGQDTAQLIDAGIAGGTAPIHHRDSATGRPIDVMTKAYSTYDMDGYQPGQWLDPGPPIPPNGPDPSAPGYDNGSGGYHVQAMGHWTVQRAHLCEMSYLAGQFTQDPIFLEDLQYMAEFAAIGDDGKWSGPTHDQPPPNPTSEYRGQAWINRTLMMAWIATKDAEDAGTLPATCHPSSTYNPVLDVIRDRYLGVIANPDPNIQAFRLLDGSGRFGPWQHEYNMLTLSFAMLIGMKDWEPIYLWALKNTIDRTSGTEWPVGYGGAYYLNTVRGGGAASWPDDAAQAYNGIVPPIPAPADFGKRFTKWSEAFEDMHLYGRVFGAPSGLTDAQYQALLKDPVFGGGLVNMAGREYTQNTHAVLAAAAFLHFKKLVDVRAVFPQLDTCLANVERQLAGDTFNPRASIINDATAPPVVVTPLPPVTELPPVDPPTNPPPTGIPMTDFVQGVTVPLFLKADGKTYGVVITATPAGQVNTTQPVGPDANGLYQSSFTPVVDLTEEDFSIDAFVRTDPTDATKGFHKTLTGHDVRKAATADGTTFGTVKPA
jgi:hypothetical protein